MSLKRTINCVENPNSNSSLSKKQKNADQRRTVESATEQLNKYVLPLLSMNETQYPKNIAGNADIQSRVVHFSGIFANEERIRDQFNLINWFLQDPKALKKIHITELNIGCLSEAEKMIDSTHFSLFCELLRMYKKPMNVRISRGIFDHMLRHHDPTSLVTTKIFENKKNFEMITFKSTLGFNEHTIQRYIGETTFKQLLCNKVVFTTKDELLTEDIAKLIEQIFENPNIKKLKIFHRQSGMETFAGFKLLREQREKMLKQLEEQKKLEGRIVTIRWYDQDSQWWEDGSAVKFGVGTSIKTLKHKLIKLINEKGVQVPQFYPKLLLQK